MAPVSNSLSTAASAYRYIHPTALRGAKDSKAKLRIEGADGQLREVEMPRTLALGNVAAPPRRKTPIYQVLANGYGYIDLARLPLADDQKAMDAVMKAPELIFDMRGYPNGTDWEIGPRFWYARFKSNVTDFPTGLWPTYTLWQFSSEIHFQKAIPGTKKDMDVNVFNGTIEDIRSQWPLTRK